MSGTRLPSSDRVRSGIRFGFGLLFLWSSGVHVGIVAADAGLYRDVADAAWFPGVRTAWLEVFMAHPGAWGIAVALGELTIAVLLLSAGRRARLGLLAAAAFHGGLMVLGWGFWLWAVPALSVLLGAWPTEPGDRMERVFGRTPE